MYLSIYRSILSFSGLDHLNQSQTCWWLISLIISEPDTQKLGSWDPGYRETFLKLPNQETFHVISCQKYRNINRMLSKNIHRPSSLFRLVNFPSSIPILDTVYPSKCRKALEIINIPAGNFGSKESYIFIYLAPDLDYPSQKV